MSNPAASQPDAPSGSQWRQILRGSRGVPRTRWTAGHMWRPTPASFVSLLVGLWLFGTGEAFLFAANLGATPWGVLAQGVSRHVGIDIGWATFVVGLVVLLAWIPLKQRPGLGTISNIIVISIAVDVVYSHMSTPPTLLLRFLLMLAGIATIGLGSGFYLTDYRSEGYKTAAKNESTNSKPATKSEAKAETKLVDLVNAQATLDEATSALDRLLALLAPAAEGGAAPTTEREAAKLLVDAAWDTDPKCVINLQPSPLSLSSLSPLGHRPQVRPSLTALSYVLGHRPASRTTFFSC